MVEPKLGRYTILHPLARGGMADLLLARADGIAGFERHVVIKRIRAEQAKDKDFVAMFLSEAKLAASLHHSNIVQVTDVGEVDGAPYFAMEYIHGEDARAFLRNHHDKKEQVPIEHVLTIALGVAAALHHAHEQRGPDRKPLDIVHRDVTPANILVAYDGNVKLVDFGIAKAVMPDSVVTEVGMLKGKAPYMSPEQCSGKPVDRRSDLFSLGIVLYELATVRRLFKGTTEFLTMSAIVQGLVPPPTRHRKDLPPALEKIIMKALARDRSRRYQTADQMRIELEELAKEHGGASTTALGSYLKTRFGERPEPWLVDKAPEIRLVDFDGSASGVASPPVAAIERDELPASVGKDAPIARARTKAITGRQNSDVALADAVAAAPVPAPTPTPEPIVAPTPTPAPAAAKDPTPTPKAPTTGPVPRQTPLSAKGLALPKPIPRVTPAAIPVVKADEPTTVEPNPFEDEPPATPVPTARVLPLPPPPITSSEGSADNIDHTVGDATAVVVPLPPPKPKPAVESDDYDVRIDLDPAPDQPKKKLTPKTKLYAALGGGAVLLVIVILAIGMTGGKKLPTPPPPPKAPIVEATPPPPPPPEPPKPEPVVEPAAAPPDAAPEIAVEDPPPAPPPPPRPHVDPPPHVAKAPPGQATTTPAESCNKAPAASHYQDEAAAARTHLGSQLLVPEEEASMMNRLTPIVVGTVLALGRLAHADPSAAAKPHIAAAMKAHAAGNFQVALDELTIAYKLAPQPELLFAIGQVYGKLDRCQDAIDAYDKFLATQKDPDARKITEQAIEACRTTLAAKAPPPPPPPPPSPPSNPPPPPVAPPVGGPPAFYKDVVGDALVIGGVVACVIGGVTYGAARGQLDDAEASHTLADYQSHVDSAHTDRIMSVVLVGGGVALFAAGVARFMIKHGSYESARAVTLVPTTTGGMLVWEGRWP